MGKTRTPYPAEFRGRWWIWSRPDARRKKLAREFEPTALTIIDRMVKANRDVRVRHDEPTTPSGRRSRA